MGMKQKKTCFENENKNGRLKKLSFSKTANSQKNFSKINQSILPIHEIFMKKFQELVVLKNSVFLSQPF
jgi:hypothetical protein